MNTAWNEFATQLAESGKLDEFCALDDGEVESWLVENGYTVTVDELAAAAPKQKLDDSQLEDISGGRVVIHSIINMLGNREDAGNTVVIH